MRRLLDRTRAFTWALAALLAAAAATRADAQDTTLVRVRGTVLTETGEPLPGASVTFTRIEPSGDFERGTVTSAAGEFDVLLPAGRYRYRVARLGLGATRGETTVAPGAAAPLVITLRTEAAIDFNPLPGLTPSRYFNLYDVNYFSGGWSESRSGRPPTESANQVKFRVAVRFKVVDWLACDDCRSGLYAAYSQNSFWHLYDDSAPFFDNNYSPGALVYHALGENRGRRDPEGLAVFGGFFHESNGRDLPYSRGWNRWMAGASLGSVNRTKVSGSLTLWHPVGMEPTNPDLPDYAGRGEAEVYLQPFLRGNDIGPLTLQLRSRLFGRQAVTNLEANALVHLSGSRSRVFTPSLLVQLFSGYAENLLTYQEKRTVVRAGIAIGR